MASRLAHEAACVGAVEPAGLGEMTRQRAEIAGSYYVFCQAADLSRSDWSLFDWHAGRQQSGGARRSPSASSEQTQ